MSLSTFMPQTYSWIYTWTLFDSLSCNHPTNQRSHSNCWRKIKRSWQDSFHKPEKSVSPRDVLWDVKYSCVVNNTTTKKKTAILSIKKHLCRCNACIFTAWKRTLWVSALQSLLSRWRSSCVVTRGNYTCRQTWWIDLPTSSRSHGGHQKTTMQEVVLVYSKFSLWQDYSSRV